MEHDYNHLRLAEMASISDLLDSLDDDQFDRPSLCDGWRVRDVISHMCVGYTFALPTITAKVARNGFSVDKASMVESIAYGDAHTPAQLRATYRRIHEQNIRKGISRFIPNKEGLVDHMTHHQDIRRPLGLPREMPGDRLVAALDAVPRIGGFLKAKGRARGLRLVASDVDWTWGDGPELKGPGEAILLALGGRPSVLDELGGEGATVLRDRVSA
jgi:uncharacterized protein (TIGR03083 family)